MKLYGILSRIFPGSFSAKVFFIAFVGIHFPLVTTVLYLLQQRGGFTANMEVVVTILAATLVGTLATLASLAAVLRPLYHVRDALTAFETRRERLPLPVRFRDEIGTVMTMVDRLMRNVGTELKETRVAADTDPLTGVLNRRGFEIAVGAEGTGSLVFLDLDHFKQVNDSFGHDVGDKTLCNAARLVQDVLRDTDRLARFGGEEFVIFLPRTSGRQAVEIAERARQALAHSLQTPDGPVTASFGVAERDAGTTLDAAMKRADEAVYAAKARGRNQVCLWQLEDATIVAA